MNPLTLIVTINHTTQSYADKCIASIKQQTQQQFDLIILQEEDTEILEMTAPLPDHYYRYQGALAAALTKIIATIRTEYVSIIDAKDWLESSYTEAFTQSLRTPSVDLIIGNYARFLPDSAEFLFHVFGEDKRTIQATKRLLRHLDYLNTQDEAYRRLGNTFIKTDILKKISIPNLSRAELEEQVLRDAYQVAETVMYHHQSNYMVRVLNDSQAATSLANIALITDIATTCESDDRQVHQVLASQEKKNDILSHFTNPELPIKVLPIPESLTYISEHHASVARYGDGEMDIMTGHSIPYQDFNEALAKELRDIYSRPSDESFVVCQSDVFENLHRYNEAAQVFWRGHLAHYEDFYRELSVNPWYGSTFISRPYIDLADKSASARYFEQLRQLWEGRDILIVEGVTSRSGVGNDLFDNAHSISRIIGPSRNAYAKVDELEVAIEKYGKNKLVLLMLGPTAKVLSYRLSRKGYWTIDIGHIDSEYEWFKMGATTKVKLSHKHTAEHNFDENITLEKDDVYETQIVAQIH